MRLKVVLELNPDSKSDAQQGDMIMSSALHFSHHVHNSVFINKIIKVFFQTGDIDEVRDNSCGLIWRALSASEVKPKIRVLGKTDLLPFVSSARCLFVSIQSKPKVLKLGGTKRSAVPVQALKSATEPIQMIVTAKTR